MKKISKWLETVADMMRLFLEVLSGEDPRQLQSDAAEKRERESEAPKK